MTTMFHPNLNSIVPWNANYSYPSQATQVTKSTVKIQPLGSTSFSSNSRATFPIPTDGYINMKNSYFTVDIALGGSGGSLITYKTGRVTLASPTTVSYATGDATSGFPVSPAVNEFENWVMYLRSESGHRWDLYRVVSNLAAAASVVVLTVAPVSVTSDAQNFGLPVIQTRQAVFTQVALKLPAGVHSIFKRAQFIYGGLKIEDIQEYHLNSRIIQHLYNSRVYQFTDGQFLEGFSEENGSALLGSRLTQSERDAPTLQLQFRPYLGIMDIEKLYPAKWMAATGVFEFEFNSFDVAFQTLGGINHTVPNTYQYSIQRMELVAEIMHFDSVYDTAFWEGMETVGIPLKMKTWNHNVNSLNSIGLSQHQIRVAAKSLKSIYSVVTDSRTLPHLDCTAFYNNAGVDFQTTNLGELQITAAVAKCGEFQWRLGGKYMPAQPVRCSGRGVEALMELKKASNTLGSGDFGNIKPHEFIQDGLIGANTLVANAPGTRFIMGCELENIDVFPNTIAGVNTQNQSDITFSLRLDGAAPVVSKQLRHFSCYDQLVLLKSGRVVQVIM